jgi:hypothetical protein
VTATPSLTASSARSSGAWTAPAAAFTLTAGLLAVIQLKVARPMLLAERFVPGAGWAELLLLAVYAAWLAGRMQDPSASARWRRRVWSLFSAVFFGQLLLGLAGFERLLMSGKLHLPIPALIVAGPLYRGEGLFMPILFVSTLLLVGPAWCSHLCYVGSWDLAFASRQRHPKPLPRWRERARVAMLATVALAAIVLRLLGASPMVAAGVAIGFAVAGIGVMALVSRRTGSMAHCTLWCPIGLLSVILGKLSPFRMRIAGSYLSQQPRRGIGFCANSA